MNTEELYDLLNLEALLINKFSEEEVKTELEIIRGLIRKHRGDSQPVCLMADDCSVIQMSKCLWRFDCEANT